MKILLWGINYRPEATGIAPFNAELAEFLAARGDEVRVVTGFAYYPGWRKRPDDRGRLYRTETVGGVRVHRCAQYVPARASTARRIVHELSFAFSSLLRVLVLPRADLYLVVSPPLLLGPCAWLATRLKRSRYVFHVQDLQPGAAVGLGMVRGRAFIRLLFAVERFSYRGAAAVSGISDGMMKEFARKGVPAERRFYFPNWLRGRPAERAEGGGFRRRLGLPADALLAVYAGNLGRKQGIDVLVEAARVLDGDDSPAAARVMILIVGAGAGREELARQIEGRSLARLRLLPLLDDDDYAAMLAETDVGLITQAPGTGRFFFPSKLLTLLDAGIPVATVADESSELAQAVAEGGFGVNVPPRQPEKLAAALCALAADAGWRAELRARTVWVRRFRAAAVLPAFAQQLERLRPAPPAASGLELPAGDRASRP